MNRKSLKKFMSRASGQMSSTYLFSEGLADPAAYDPNLPELTLLNLVHQALLALRHNSAWQAPEANKADRVGENEKGSETKSSDLFCWEHPWVELRYPVEWDWSNAQSTLESPVESPVTPHRDRLDWLIKTTRHRQELMVFEVLTHGAAKRRRAGRDFIIPSSVHSNLINEALQEIPAKQHEKWIEAYLDLLLKPFTVGLMNDFADEEEDHPMRRLENVPPVRFSLEGGVEGLAVVQVHPLVIDEVEQRAYYPVIAGLSLWPQGKVPKKISELLWKSAPADPVAGWTTKQKEAQWEKIFAALFDVESLFRSEPESSSRQRGRGEGDSDYPSTPLPTPKVITLTQQQRYLLEGPTRMDKRAATLVAYTHGLNLPRRWSTVRPWHQLEALEIERLQKELGEAAFKAQEEEEKKTKRKRGALLLRRTRPSGEVVVELSEEAARELGERESLRGFRRLIRDEDGVQREYLIKRIRTPKGFLEIRLSWYGMVWPFVEDAVEYRETSLQALNTQPMLGQPSLFEELEERRRADLNGQLRQMEAIRDARLVMDLILRTFGRNGENPLHVPAWQLRSLLECENENDGFRRVEGCLRALQEVRFSMHSESKGLGATVESFGPFIGDVKYIGRGRGRPTDGDYYLQISPGAIGCLQVFSTGQYKASNAERVMTYDWNRTLTREQRQELSGYDRGFLTLAPYYDRAKGFTPTQSNLLRFIERELTLNKDSARKSHRIKRAEKKDKNANEPRLYGHDFCPLLPRALHFYGALGHFTRNPETGRKLQSSRSQTSESLLSVMGQVLPSKRARIQRQKVLTQVLQDMKAVVEEALGGHAIAWKPEEGKKRKGSWLTLKDAADLTEEELLQVSWFLFIAPDFRARLATDLEKYHAERYADGKTPYPIQVTHDQEKAKKSYLQVAGEHYESVEDTVPLRVRLKEHRTANKLSQARVGELFGVSQKTIGYWEKGPLPDKTGKVRGKPIPREMIPYVIRWIDTGQAPTPQELAARTTRRAGVRNPEKSENRRKQDKI